MAAPTNGRRLVLVRHAKAAQGVPDVDRPLTDRGRDDAQLIGRWLGEQGVVPDLVVVSPARRARQTWAAAAPTLGVDVPLVVDERIYANTVGDLYAVVRDCDPGVQRLALVGHNPSMHALAAQLAGSSDEVAEFPTATVAVFAVEGAWADLEVVATAVAGVVTCRA